MPEITFVTVPGADDIIIDDVSLNDVDRFRSQCLLGGSVVCTWDTLHARLMNHDVSRFWWLLTESERCSITETVVKNTFFYTIYRMRTGQPNCGGGVGGWKSIDCGYNALIRYLKFNDSSFSGADTCYWKKMASTPDSDEHCYKPTNSYGLPCYLTFCGTMESGFGHYMCAMPINKKINSLDGYIFFQYSDFDIKPEHWQMPTHKYDLYIKIHNLEKFKGCGSQTWSDKIIARFDI